MSALSRPIAISSPFLRTLAIAALMGTAALASPLVARAADYRAPPVVYGHGYGYGEPAPSYYYAPPPPVYYGSGIGLSLPGVNFNFH